MIEANMKTYIAKHMPFITPKNKLKRLEFAKRYISKPASFWRNVLWTDESSFEFHASQKKVFVRANKNYRKKIASAKGNRHQRSVYFLLISSL